jgi:hypothetical protein
VKEYRIYAVIPLLTNYLEQNKEGNKYISRIVAYNPDRRAIPEFWEIEFTSGTTVEEAFNEIAK